MARDRDRDTDDLRPLLDDLRATLEDLDRALEQGTDDGRDSRPPARPRGSDVVRFTEEYTIPTVISVLETTIQSLELLQGVLRLANPDRRDSVGRRDRTSRLERRVADGTERALDDLRQVLTGTEEPTDPVARDVFREARELTAEIESILDESRSGQRRGGRDRERGRRESPDDRSAREPSDRQSVVIPVDDETDRTDADDADGGHGDDADGGQEDEADGSTVDVEAELASIRDEVGAESAVGAGDETDEEDGEERQSSREDEN